MPLDLKESIRIQEETLSRLLDWISSMNARVQFVSTISIAILGALTAVFAGIKEPDALKWAALLGGGFCPALSLFSCWLAMFPRVEGPEKSLIFFKRIKQLAVEDYQTQVIERTGESYLSDLTVQCHRNAEIADTKFESVQHAMMLMFIGTVIFLIALWILCV